MSLCLKKKNPHDWKELFINFEKAKPSVKLSSQNSLNLTLSFNLGKEVKTHFEGQRIDKIINAKRDLGVSFRNGSLVITHEKAKSLFTPVTQDLVKHLKKLDRDLKGERIKYVLLVGGFAQSEILQEAVKEHFKSSDCRVLVPSEAQLAVVKGAVMFGHDPSVISSRIARVTYGIEVMREFDAKQHDPRYQEHSEGIIWCTSLFKPIIQKDESIEVGTEKSIKVGTNFESRTKGETEIEIYSSDKKDVKYTYDSGVSLVTKLCVKHTGSAEDYSARKQPIEIVVKFGGTELNFRAKADKKGHWVDTSVKFFGD